MELYYPIVGGAETHAKLLNHELKQKGMKTMVITRRRTTELPAHEKIDEVPVYRVRPTGHARIGKYLMMMPAFSELIRRRKDYDVIYVCGLRVLGVVGVAAAKMLGKRCIVRSESCGEVSGGFMFGKGSIEGNSLKEAVGKLLICARNAILKQADGYVAISNVIQDEYIAAGLDKKKIAFIPNGIDTDKYSPATDGEKNRLRKALGLPADKTLFLYTGKLNKGKGLEMLLRAWKRAAQSDSNLHLLLVGGGGLQVLSCEDELRTFVQQNLMENNVTFTGYVNNVIEYLKAADVFVFASESEAQGLSLVEALSCGLPAIATSAGGISDFLEDGVNGRLIPIDDEDSLVNVIAEFVDDVGRAGKLGVQGRKTAVDSFDTKKDVERHISLFNEDYLSFE